MNESNLSPSFPHHRLVAWQVAVQLVVAARDLKIADAQLQDEASRAVKKAYCNVSEGAGKLTRADKARVWAIARGEVLEAAGVIEVAMLMGIVDQELAAQCLQIAGRLAALLTGLIRRRY